MAWYLQASTGKRMHRTHSHNKLVHEAVSVCVSPPLSCACVALFLSFLCSSLSYLPRMHERTRNEQAGPA